MQQAAPPEAAEVTAPVQQEVVDLEDGRQTVPPLNHPAPTRRGRGKGGKKRGRGRGRGGGDEGDKPPPAIQGPGRDKEQGGKQICRQFNSAKGCRFEEDK